MASALFYCDSIEEHTGSHHQISDVDNDFQLEACFMCQKPLGLNCDIFMYRGNKAFCSDECRQEQIGHDEAKERRKKIAARAMRKTATTASSVAEKASPSSTTAVGAVSVA